MGAQMRGRRCRCRNQRGRPLALPCMVVVFADRALGFGSLTVARMVSNVVTATCVQRARSNGGGKSTSQHVAGKAFGRTNQQSWHMTRLLKSQPTRQRRQ